LPINTSTVIVLARVSPEERLLMSTKDLLAVNARVTAFAMGGQQRVAQEIMNRLTDAEAIMPAKPLGGIKGHAWEQAVLPFRAAGRVLWSPSATGPLLYRKQVVTVHDTAFFDVPEYFAPSFVRLYQTLVPRLARRVAKVVTVSDYSRQQIAKRAGMDPARIEVIYNGVASHFRPYDPAAILAARAALNLPERYVLVQATSDKRKNLARTLDAWRQVVDTLPEDLHLVVSGNLSRAHVFGDASDINLDGPRIQVIGYVAEEHMGPLMAGAEAFLFASLYEGFGLPVLEAMSAGTPVITGNTTSLPEVAGDAAQLVDARSTDAIARAILDVIQRPLLAQTLKMRGFSRAKGFTWDAAAERYAAVFRALQSAPVNGKKDGVNTSALREPSPIP
jgi:glycosyltransferase involved in cell wall biosynthesis